MAADGRFRTLLDHAPGAILLLDGAGRVQCAGAAVETLLGYAVDALVGRDLLDFVHPDDLPVATETLHLGRRGAGVASSTVVRLRDAGGRWRSIELAANNCLDIPTLKSIVVWVHDVTDRARAERALRDAEARYRGIFENAVEGLFQVRTDGRFETLNPAMAQILGFASPAAALARVRRGRDLFVEQARYDQIMQQVWTRGQVIEAEVQMRRADGAEVWLSLNARAIRDGRGVVVRVEGSASDVTARRRADEVMRFQGRLLDAVGQAVVAVDRGRRVAYWNRGAEDLYGWTWSEALGRDLLGVLPGMEGDAFAVESAWPDAARGWTWSGECTVRRRDGSLVPVALTTAALHDEGGRLGGFIGISHDVSERHASAAALATSEDRLRALVQNVSDMIVIYDRDGVARYVSPVVETMLGYTPSDMVGGDIYRYAHPDDHAPLRAHFAAAGLRSGSQAPFEARLRRRDGAWRTLEAVPVSLFDHPAIAGLVVTWRDVTERRHAEESLRRLAAIVESSEDAIISRDLDGVVTSWNAGAERIFGFAAEEMVGRSIRLVAPEERWPEVDDLARRVQGERVLQLETRRLRRDGAEIDVSISMSPLRRRGPHRRLREHRAGYH
ncbi:MAG: PAS domain S-box protein [Dehalococcoidia bacterium]